MVTTAVARSRRDHVPVPDDGWSAGTRPAPSTASPPSCGVAAVPGHEGREAGGERRPLLLVDTGRPAPPLHTVSVPDTRAESAASSTGSSTTW